MTPPGQASRDPLGPGGEVNGRGAQADARAAFYFDLGSPECYLAAERLGQVLAAPVAWNPVLARALPAAAAIDPEATERRAREQSLQPIRWPESFPFDSEQAMLVATYAKRIGRVAAFAVAAFRQAFAGGRSLAEVDTVLLAAAACEMHPRAVLQAAGRPRTRAELLSLTEEAARTGVTALPAIAIGGRLFSGSDALDRAATCR